MDVKIQNDFINVLYTKYDDTLYFIADKDISMKYIRNILKTNAIFLKIYMSCIVFYSFYH